MGSPPPAGSKKEVLKFRSVRSIVIAPAKTGRERRSKNVVTSKDQTNSPIWSKRSPLGRMLKIVVIKLIAPKREDTPAKCKAKITKSTEAPPCPNDPDKGG